MFLFWIEIEIVWGVLLWISLSGNGKSLPVKYDLQMRYGVYMVEADYQPYTDCFFLSVLIFKSYYDNDQLYRRLECGAKISDLY